MLSRTADSLFWMARYIERAENTARMLDVQRQAVLLPSAFALQRSSYEQLLVELVSDAGNPSSILNSLAAARENCRSARDSVNTDLWETVNTTWLELQPLLQDAGWQRDARELLEWVKVRSHLFRGVAIGTMLKDQAFHFMRLGTFIERADSTARILDSKFVFDRTDQENESAPNPLLDQRMDYYYWASILHAVSAFEIYRRVYRDVVTPRRVAELLIQRPDMPRSLLACMNEVNLNLEAIGQRYSGESQRLAGKLRSELQYLKIDSQFERGIHAFLQGFVEQVYSLGVSISVEYLGTQQPEPSLPD
ncbi:MAG: alpha-E domain-containing protein [Burkholderiaceae bacterium]|nr:alpha-E domain-containing protein [Burkholderiaceae bacterium]